MIQIPHPSISAARRVWRRSGRRQRGTLGMGCWAFFFFSLHSCKVETGFPHNSPVATIVIELMSCIFIYRTFGMLNRRSCPNFLSSKLFMNYWDRHVRSWSSIKDRYACRSIMFEYPFMFLASNVGMPCLSIAGHSSKTVQMLPHTHHVNLIFEPTLIPADSTCDLLVS